MARKSPFHQLAEWASRHVAREIRMETDGNKVRLVAVTWVADRNEKPGDFRADFNINAFALTPVNGNLVSAIQRASSHCLNLLSGKADPTKGSP